MIIGENFKGDNNKALQMEQDNIYWESISLISSLAIEAYLHASEIVDVETDLRMEIRKLEGVDHRTIQYFHDVLAGKFRKVNQYRFEDDFFRKPIKPKSKECKYLWLDFLRKELDRLYRKPYFLRAVCESFVYANTELGYQAENRLYEYLHDENDF